MKIKQRALITSIDDHNKSFEVKITNCQAGLEAGSDGNVLLPMLSAKLGDYFEVGDEIEFKKLSESDLRYVEAFEI